MKWPWLERMMDVVTEELGGPQDGRRQRISLAVGDSLSVYDARGREVVLLTRSSRTEVVMSLLTDQGARPRRRNRVKT